ncbi:MAG: DUF4421 family protein [Bacteroidota bacterium]
MLRFVNIFLFFPIILFGQNRYTSYNSEYIEKMDNTINLKLDIDNDLRSFEYNSEDLSYVIAPNTSLRTSLAFNYRFISFKIGYSPKFLTQSVEDEKGKTKVFKIQTDLFFNQWMQSLEYSKVKGYYIRDIQDPNGFLFNTDSDFIKLPDLNTVTFTGRTQYTFNKNFSLKALMRQTEIQRKSAGSVITSFTFNYLDIRDQTSIQDLNSLGLILNAGYMYNFVISRRWFALIGLSPGIGIEFNKVTTPFDSGNETNNDTSIVANIFSQIGLGYNSKSFYSGIDLRGIVTSRDEKAIIKFNTARSIFRFYVGYRFKAPKVIKEGVDWIEYQNPLN